MHAIIVLHTNSKMHTTLLAICGKKALTHILSEGYIYTLSPTPPRLIPHILTFHYPAVALISFTNVSINSINLCLLNNSWLLLLQVVLVARLLLVHTRTNVVEARAIQEVGKTDFAVDLSPALLLALGGADGAEEGIHFFLHGLLAIGSKKTHENKMSMKGR